MKTGSPSSSELRTEMRSNEGVGVLVVADVRLYREGIASNLGRRDELTVVGSAANWDEALQLVTASHPDVVVLDMAFSRSLELVRALKAEAPGVKIIAFAVEDVEGEILACAEAGVEGYVPCDGSINDLVATIHNVTRGELHCPPRISASLFRHVASLAGSIRKQPERAALTWREREVLGLIRAGLSNKEIAAKLRIEVSTVKNHVHNVLEKVHATSRTQAAAELRSETSTRRRAKVAAAD